MKETIEYTAEGPLGQVWLSRPEKLNPLSAQTLGELIDAASWFDRQPDVRVVTFGGRGRAFCAGADLAPANQPDITAREAAERGRRMADTIGSMRAITVAGVHGFCIGGGVVLLTACDLRLAQAGTIFSIPEVDLGLPLTWGGLPRLVRDVGPVVAKELILTCWRFDADEAKEMGLINQVVDSEVGDAASELAATLCEKSALALDATKRHVNAVADGMVGLVRTWNDSDSLLVAQHDRESLQAGARYLKGLDRQ